MRFKKTFNGKLKLLYVVFQLSSGKNIIMKKSFLSAIGVEIFFHLPKNIDSSTKLYTYHAMKIAARFEKIIKKYTLMTSRLERKSLLQIQDKAGCDADITTGGLRW